MMPIPPQATQPQAKKPKQWLVAKRGDKSGKYFRHIARPSDATRADRARHVKEMEKFMDDHRHRHSSGFVF